MNQTTLPFASVMPEPDYLTLFIGYRSVRRGLAVSEEGRNGCTYEESSVVFPSSFDFEMCRLLAANFEWQALKAFKEHHSFHHLHFLNTPTPPSNTHLHFSGFAFYRVSNSGYIYIFIYIFFLYVILLAA